LVLLHCYHAEMASSHEANATATSFEHLPISVLLSKGRSGLTLAMVSF